MKTAGMVLGIVGSTIGILFVLYIGLVSIILTEGLSQEFKITLKTPEQSVTEDSFSSGDSSADAVPKLPPTPPVKVVTSGFDDSAVMSFLFPIILLSAVLVGSGLGLAGALMSRKKAVVGGVLMIIGAVFNLFDIIGFILLLIGGIFALVSAKQTGNPSLA